MIWPVSGFAIGVVMLAVSLIIDTTSMIKVDQPTLEGSAVIEILNGSGIKKAGERVSAFLCENGFDVLFVGNADDFDYAETVVVDCVGDISRAMAVASFLNCKNVIRQVEHFPLVEVKVIVGKDTARIQTL